MNQRDKEYQIGSHVQRENDRNAIVQITGGADSVPALYYVAKITGKMKDPDASESTISRAISAIVTTKTGAKV